MFMSKVLISCAILVAAQAGYAPASKYSGHGAVVGGYAAQLQPAATLTVLPSHGGYGAAPVYGGAYGAGHLNSYAAHGPAYAGHVGHAGNAANALNAEALNLANLVWALPSAGGPIASTINVPQYSTTLYTSPAVVAVPSSGYGVSGANAAAAASNVASVYPAGAPAAPSYGASSHYAPALSGHSY